MSVRCSNRHEGAGFSADSGLAVYDDVAKAGNWICSVPIHTWTQLQVKAYAERELDYMDLCDPKLVYREPPLFWGFWGQCFNDYRHRLAAAVLVPHALSTCPDSQKLSSTCLRSATSNFLL